MTTPAVTTEYVVPCGTAIVTDGSPITAAILHAAGCRLCRTAVRDAEMTEGGPQPQTTSVRRAEAVHTSELLHAYAYAVTDGAQPRLVERLLQSIASLERVLWMESGGRAGVQFSNVDRVRERFQ